ncbi:GNAT family N-acetyltransferase, partial [bacterium]|nr:GNAT family N-acetyltransferase [bacterium]
MKQAIVLKSLRQNFIIQPYRTGDEDRILSTWKEAFNKEMAPDFWQWKYPCNPAGFRIMLCLAENGEVAAHYAAQVCKISFQDQEWLGLQLTDNFSHPKYRWALCGKTGLFVKTARAFLKTYLEEIPIDTQFELATDLPKAQFHYGFPGIRHYRLGIKLMHYRLHQPGTVCLRFT